MHGFIFLISRFHRLNFGSLFNQFYFVLENLIMAVFYSCHIRQKKFARNIIALKSAYNRKVKVEVIQDIGQYEEEKKGAKKNVTYLDELTEVGITTYIDDFHSQTDKNASAHNKIKCLSISCRFPLRL